jgi:hypothetical protein
MSSAPANGKATQAIGPGGRGSVDRAGASVDRAGASIDRTGAKAAAAAKVKKPMTPEQRQQMMVIGIAAAVVLGVGLAIYAYFGYTRSKNAPPPLDAQPLSIAQFVASPKFDLLPFEKQRLYMKELAGKRKELEAEYKAGKLQKEPLEDALAVGWLGKQLKHIDTYYSLNELDKKYLLDKILDGQLRENAEGKDELSKDKKKVTSLVERFPDQRRRDYESFRKALKEREKERDKEAKAAARAAKATSRPASRPGERPDPAKAATPGAKPMTPANGTQKP